MSETSDFEHKNHFSTESDFYLSPYDLYNERVLQFMALEAMGYPVRLEELSVATVRKSLLFQNDDLYNRWSMQFPVWVRPVVARDDFAKYVEDPDVLGDIFNPDNVELFPEGVAQEIGDVLENHIAEINANIDCGDINALARFVKLHEDGAGKQWFKDIAATPYLGINEQEILLRAVASGAERRKQLEATSYPFPRHPYPRVEAVALVDEVRRARIKPLDTEAQIGLLIDYYQLIESLVPQFTKFKKAGR